jgi:HAD superfamily hydrolase (TIGR01456 family)
MPAMEDSDLHLRSSNISIACHRHRHNISHKRQDSRCKGENMAPMSNAENGMDDGTFEVPASRSPYGDASKHMHSLSHPLSRKERRTSRNSFGAALPIPHPTLKASLSPVFSEDDDLIPFPTQHLWKPIIAAAKNMAFAFDIDGVFVQGERLIKQGRRALQILNGDNNLGIKIPYIFLTNGGGKLEIDRCAQLTRIFNIGTPVSPFQLIQSHTPMRALKEYHSTVLIIGGEGDKCKSIAQQYGFTDIVVSHDIVAWDPTISPFRKLSPAELAAAKPRDFSKVNINAILVFTSSRDYATDLQIIVDLLRSSHGRLGTVASDPVTERIPIYFSQGDLVFPNGHYQPRLSQGAFRIGLEAMYKSLTGVELERVVYGKPERATYMYAEEVLGLWIDSLYGEGARVPENVYMVGDNPASDICGGNMYGWNTCLVKTGVFQADEGKNDEDNPASFGVFEDVLEAVAAAIRKELGTDFRFDWNHQDDLDGAEEGTTKNGHVTAA